MKRAAQTLGAALLLWSASPQAEDYYRFDVQEEVLHGAPDQQSLNEAIDQRGRLFVKYGRFHRTGPDGQAYTDDDARVRLFGINLSFAANFPNRQEAVRLAKRLRKLGFNAVRLHHLDTSPSTDNDPPRSVLLPGPYPRFNPEAIERLRFFIQVLGEEGLYVNLNLHVGYVFGPTDGIAPYPLDGMTRPNASPIKVFDPELIERQVLYARQLISALGLSHAPNLAMVEISNESSLLAAWHRREWLDAVPGPYYDLLTQQWHAWLQRRYQTPAKAALAWKQPARAEWPLMPEPAASRQAGSMLSALYQQARARLEDWIPGSADPAVASPPSPQTDFQRFLADTDQAYFSHMRQAILSTLSWPTPITGSQQSYGGMMNRLSHRDMDYLDDHFYIDHPHYLAGFSQRRNWRIWDTSLTGTPQMMQDKLLTLAYRRNPDKPFVVSEFNHPFPSRQGAEVVPLTALFASVQDWDGLFFFDYASHLDTDNAPSSFALRGDWGKYANLGQSARLFRRFQILPPPRKLSIQVPADALPVFSALDPEQGLLDAVVRRTAQPMDQAWHQRVELRIGASGALIHRLDPVPTSPPAAALDYSATDQRLVFSGRLAAGWFGRSLPDAAASTGLRVSTTDGGKVSVMWTSLDGLPLDQSRQVLISVGSAVVGSQPGSLPPRPKQWIRHPSGESSWTLEPDPGAAANEPSGSRAATAPSWLTRTPLKVSWPTQRRIEAIYPLHPDGRRRAALKSERASHASGSSQAQLHQSVDESSLWYEVVLR